MRWARTGEMAYNFKVQKLFTQQPRPRVNCRRIAASCNRALLDLANWKIQLPLQDAAVDSVVEGVTYYLARSLVDVRNPIILYSADEINGDQLDLQ
jgi:hypothetical protein